MAALDGVIASLDTTKLIADADRRVWLADRPVTMLARTDGLFVMELSFRDPIIGPEPPPMGSKKRPAYEQQEVELQTLSLAAALAAKEVLEHTHHFHVSSTKQKVKRRTAVAGGKTPSKPPPSSDSESTPAPRPVKNANRLSAAQALTGYPIRLSGDWRRALEGDELSDHALAHANGVRPSKAPDQSTLRSALICLRREYFRIFEDLTSTLEDDRASEAAFARGWVRWVCVSFALALAVLFLYKGIVEVDFVSTPHVYRPRFLLWSWSWETSFMLSDIASAAITTVMITAAVVVWWPARRFQRPRIKLLRNAGGFFRTAEPLNAIIVSVLKPKNLAPQMGFQAAIDNIEQRCASEEHRLSQKQYLIALLIALSALVASVRALAKHDDELSRRRAPAVVQSDRVLFTWDQPPAS